MTFCLVRAQALCQAPERERQADSCACPWGSPSEEGNGDMPGGGPFGVRWERAPRRGHDVTHLHIALILGDLGVTAGRKMGTSFFLLDSEFSLSKFCVCVGGSGKGFQFSLCIQKANTVP